MDDTVNMQPPIDMMFPRGMGYSDAHGYPLPPFPYPRTHRAHRAHPSNYEINPYACSPEYQQAVLQRRLIPGRNSSRIYDCRDQTVSRVMNTREPTPRHNSSHTSPKATGAPSQKKRERKRRNNRNRRKRNQEKQEKQRNGDSYYPTEIENETNSKSIHPRNRPSRPPFRKNAPRHRGAPYGHKGFKGPMPMNNMHMHMPTPQMCPPHYDVVYVPVCVPFPPRQGPYIICKNSKNNRNRKIKEEQAMPSSNPFVTMPYEEYEEMVSTFKPSKKHGVGKTRREKSKYVSLDCEMVGVGPDGCGSALARVCVIDWSETTLLDTYVKVDEPVTDYRTFVSGVQAKDLQSDDAMSFDTCQHIVKNLLRNKILIGHGLDNDLKALGISHPPKDIRDTAKYPPFMVPLETANNPASGHRQYQSPVYKDTPSVDIAGTHAINRFLSGDNLFESDSSTVSSLSTLSIFSSSSSKTSQELDDAPSSAKSEQTMIHLRPQKLKDLTKKYCMMEIQKEGAQHSPLQDAKAVLQLYKKARLCWENESTPSTDGKNASATTTSSSNHTVLVNDSLEGDDSPLVLAAKNSQSNENSTGGSRD